MFNLIRGVPTYLAEGEASTCNMEFMASFNLKPSEFRVNSFEHLFASMIALEPSERITAEQALAHQWLNTDVATKQEVLTYMTGREQQL